MPPQKNIPTSRLSSVSRTSSERSARALSRTSSISKKNATQPEATPSRASKTGSVVSASSFHSKTSSLRSTPGQSIYSSPSTNRSKNSEVLQNPPLNHPTSNANSLVTSTTISRKAPSVRSTYTQSSYLSTSASGRNMEQTQRPSPPPPYKSQANSLTSRASTHKSPEELFATSLPDLSKKNATQPDSTPSRTSKTGSVVSASSFHSKTSSLRSTPGQSIYSSSSTNRSKNSEVLQNPPLNHPTSNANSLVTSTTISRKAPSVRSTYTQSSYLSTSASGRNMEQTQRLSPPPPYKSQENSLTSRASIHKSLEELFATSLPDFREHIYIWCIGIEVHLNIAKYSWQTGFYQRKIDQPLLQKFFALIDTEEMDSRNTQKRENFRDKLEKQLESNLDRMRDLQSNRPGRFLRIANDSALNGIAQATAGLSLGASLIDPLVTGRVVSAGGILCWAIAVFIKEMQFRKLEKNTKKLGKYIPEKDCPIIHLISLLAAIHVTAELDNNLIINYNTKLLRNLLPFFKKKNLSPSDYEYINNFIAQDKCISDRAQKMANQIFADAIERVKNNENKNKTSSHYVMVSNLILPDIPINKASREVLKEYGVYTFWLNVFAQQLDKQVSFENNKRFEEDLETTKAIIEKAKESLTEIEEEHYPESICEITSDKVSDWLESRSNYSECPSIAPSQVSKTSHASVKSNTLPKSILSTSSRASLLKQSFFPAPPSRSVSLDFANTDVALEDKYNHEKPHSLR